MSHKPYSSDKGEEPVIFICIVSGISMIGMGITFLLEYINSHTDNIQVGDCLGNIFLIVLGIVCIILSLLYWSKKS